MPSNQDIAQSLGVHYTMVSRMRSGQRTPSLSLMKQIATVYGVSMERLVKAKLEGNFHEVFNRATKRTPRVSQSDT